MLTQGFNNIVGCVVLRKKVFNAYRNETPGTEECRTEASPQSLAGQCITQILGVGPSPTDLVPPYRGLKHLYQP